MEIEATPGNLSAEGVVSSAPSEPPPAVQPAPVAAPAPRKAPLPAQFLNRELGFLAFNRRVLAQAADESVPPLERLRFITIVSSNLDEFFEIRVAGLKEQIKLELPEPGPARRPPPDVFEAVVTRGPAAVAERYR